MQHDETKLKSLARQYGWLRERGESHEEALNNLKLNAGEAYQSVLTRLAAAQQNFAQFEPFIADRLGGLSNILERTQANTGQRSALLMGGLTLSEELDIIGKNIRAKFITRFTYMIVLCLAGLLVSSIYVIYVYPQMRSAYMFSVNGGSMPTDLSPLYHLGMLGYPLVFFCLFVLTTLMYFLAVKSTFTLGSGKNFAAPLHFIPGLSTLNNALRSYLYAGLQQLYTRSGFNPSQAADIIHKFVNPSTLELKEDLEVASKLDTLDSELAYQYTSSRTSVEAALDKAASFWNGLLTVVTAVILFLMITDYYIPIFKFGTI